MGNIKRTPLKTLHEVLTKLKMDCGVTENMGINGFSR